MSAFLGGGSGPDFGAANISTTGRATFGGLTVNQAAASSGTPAALAILTGGAHTTLAASTEAPDVQWSLARTVQFAAGALATQRAVRVTAPTYAFAGASTLNQAATIAISGSPTPGANATITNRFALWLESGALGTGANPARSGSIRLSHGDAVVGRNNANTADSDLLNFVTAGAFVNDAILMGNQSLVGGFEFGWYNTKRIRFQSAGAADTDATQVVNVNRSSGNGCPLVLRAQGSTAGSAAGGLLRLEGGRAGAGGAAGQVALFGNRDDATFDEGLRVGSNGSAATLGFYGTAPIVKQTGVAVTAAAIHAALVALGLIAA